MARCKTVLYTVNKKPIIRKVFAARKEFYQSRELREMNETETSSKKLIWRHNNLSVRTCPTIYLQEPDQSAPQLREPDPLPSLLPRHLAHLLSGGGSP